MYKKIVKILSIDHLCWNGHFNHTQHTNTHTLSSSPNYIVSCALTYKAVQVNGEYYVLCTYIYTNTNRECIWFRFDGQKRTTNSGELEAKVPNQFKNTDNLNAKIYIIIYKHIFPNCVFRNIVGQWVDVFDGVRVLTILCDLLMYSVLYRNTCKYIYIK